MGKPTHTPHLDGVFYHQAMRHKTLFLRRLAQALVLSMLVCVAVFFSLNYVSSLRAQSAGIMCVNPGFEMGDLSCWREDGNEGLLRVVQTQTVFEGKYAALIGDPFTTREECAGNLPLGDAWIGYIITVPTQGDPYFSFNYRIFSYDEIVEGYEDDFDKFDVYMDDLSGSLPRFRVLREGSDDGVPPPGPPRPCNFTVDDSDWLTASWKLSSIRDFDNPGQIYDLLGKTINVIFQVFSQELVGDSAWYNTWVYIDNLQLRPEMVIHKMNSPPGPVHEGDIITYTISYANTGLITQSNVVITDKIPSNTDLMTGTISSSGTLIHNGVISWTFESLAVGETGSVSFQVRIPLLRHLDVESVSPPGTPEPTPSPARVLPAPIACDTTRFWAVGVTRQPPEPKPHTIQVQIPPGAAPSQMWLAVKEASDIGLTVDGIQATRIATSNNQIGASLWSAPITPEAVGSGVVTVVTGSPRRLNALFLFDEDDPPFDETNLYDVYNNAATVPETFTYTLEIPTVETQTIDVLLPFMDISYWRDDLQPDTRVTTVTVEFNRQSHTVAVSDPNLGNGLLMTDFPFDIGPFADAITKTRVLTITVDTEDSIYTLGPRVCRPVYIENTAWLCSDRAGCISSTVENIPEGFAPPSLYLPIILKSYP